MGKATIDPHSEKEHTNIHKVCKLIRLVLTEIERFNNIKINKEMNGHPDGVFRQCLDDHTVLSKC